MGKFSPNLKGTFEAISLMIGNIRYMKLLLRVTTHRVSYNVIINSNRPVVVIIIIIITKACIVAN